MLGGLEEEHERDSVGSAREWTGQLACHKVGSGKGRQVGGLTVCLSTGILWAGIASSDGRDGCTRNIGGCSQEHRADSDLNCAIGGLLTTLLCVSRYFTVSLNPCGLHFKAEVPKRPNIQT